MPSRQRGAVFPADADRSDEHQSEVFQQSKLKMTAELLDDNL